MLKSLGGSLARNGGKEQPPDVNSRSGNGDDVPEPEITELGEMR